MFRPAVGSNNLFHAHETKRWVVPVATIPLRTNSSGRRIALAGGALSVHGNPVNLFQTQRVGAWPKAADDNYHDDHTDGDKAERTGCPVLFEHGSNREATYNAAEPAPGINKADTLGSDVSRVQLCLVGVKGKRHKICTKRD